MKCKACKSFIKKFFSLGDMPLVNSFHKKNQIKNEKKYDLSVAFCPNCYLVQLITIIPPEVLFRDYIYFSSTSSSLLEHFITTARHLKRKLKLNEKSLVLEIASNDGEQLKAFQDLGMQILGVDPAVNIAKVANKKGIKTIPEFFNAKFAKQLTKKQGIYADVVYGANVLAHVPQIVDFLTGVKTVLKPKGSAIFEFPYLNGLFEKKFDIIYHEHVFYYSLIALENVFAQAGLKIYDVEIVPTQGKSLRIFAGLQNVFSPTKRMKALEKKERRLGFDTYASYENINKKIEKLRNDLISLLSDLKKNKKTIAAYSAPAKGNILLNYFGINANFLEFIVDRAKEKQGLYTPGTHLLVYPPEKIKQEKPDYLLILCWNIADEVMDQLSDFKASGGKFIIPIPKLQIY